MGCRRGMWWPFFVGVERVDKYRIRWLAPRHLPFLMRFREVENLRDNQNRRRAQIKEITRCAQTKFFNLLRLF